MRLWFMRLLAVRLAGIIRLAHICILSTKMHPAQIVEMLNVRLHQLGFKCCYVILVELFFHGNSSMIPVQEE